MKLIRYLIVLTSILTADSPAYFDVRLNIADQMHFDGPDNYLAGSPVTRIFGGLAQNNYEVLIYNPNGVPYSLRPVVRGDAWTHFLKLSRDLFRAQHNQDMTAQDMISKELLETASGKYGLSPVDSRDTENNKSKLLALTDMITLHAGTAAQQVAKQKKTTELMGPQISRIERNRSSTTSPDRAFFTQQNSLITQPTFAHSNPHVRDIIELSKVVTNPVHIQGISRIAWAYSENHEFRANYIYNNVIAREAWERGTESYVDNIFNFSNSPNDISLKALTHRYFNLTYAKTNQVLQFNNYDNTQTVDYNGGDIFDNGGTCTWNSTFGTFSQTPGNRTLITRGSIPTPAQLQSSQTRRINATQCTISLVPYTRYNNGYPQNMGALANANIASYFSQPETMNVYAINDLSSSLRVKLAYAVNIENLNHAITTSRFIKATQRQDALITWSDELFRRLTLEIPQESLTRNGEALIVSEPDLTALHFIVGYHPGVARQAPNSPQQHLHRAIMLEPFGMNYGYFSDRSNNWISGPIRRIRTTSTILTPPESHRAVAITAAILTDPFAPFIGVASISGDPVGHRVAISQFG
jgi:hypothetical protein